jgi:hypothetical protein
VYLIGGQTGKDSQTFTTVEMYTLETGGKILYKKIEQCKGPLAVVAIGVSHINL